PEVMALSFSNQLLCAIYIAQNHQKLEKKIYDVPEEIDRQVANNALESMGLQIDSPTDEQLKYSDSWNL
ncbi:MAG: adenosylhomocysteinase, partial [Thaumarchaeota archaeon]|nr:adenosylhomocysteinase [Nitrososphaerota archaeon]